MWVVKTQGETYYVDHVACSVPWSTKETPNNSHTKGSIKIKRCLVSIDDENVATITSLTLDDVIRLKRKNSVRLITSYGKKLKEALRNIRHSPVKLLYGTCSSEFYITDLFNKEDLPMLLLAWPGKPGEVRVLMPNEDYYKLYDSTTESSIDLDAWEDQYES